MTLTPEQLAELREKVERDYLCWRNPDVRRIFEHIDAQQARISELEQQLASANNFAGCAAHEPEPVNQQLLAVLVIMVDSMDSGEEHGAGSEWHRQAKAAIAAAKAAQKQESEN